MDIYLQAVINFRKPANLPNSKPDSDDSRILDVVYRLVKSEYMYKNIADETFAEQARPVLSVTD